jgi:hypothetical protein
MRYVFEVVPTRDQLQFSRVKGSPVLVEIGSAQKKEEVGPVCWRRRIPSES